MDNASSDDSDLMVQDEFPTVRSYPECSNGGFAAATNRGLRQCRGRYLLLLNPDTAGHPTFLRMLVTFLEARPDVAAADLG